MGRKAKAQSPRSRRGKDVGRKLKSKPCVFCQNKIDWVDYKDVNLLRRFMSDRAKIRARRVTGNCAQHQRHVAVAVKTARELALLPYATRVTSSRGGRRPRDKGGRGPAQEVPPRAGAAYAEGGPRIGDTVLPGEMPTAPDGASESAGGGS